MPEGDGEVLSPLGRNFVGGLLQHAAPCTAFTTPTVNGYRRFRPNSLAPDRATWCYDHRGVMIRVLGAPGDPASRVENRVGEPAANPYLFMMSQIVAGLDGIDACARSRSADRRALCVRSPAAAEVIAGGARRRSNRNRCSAAELGDVFVDYFLKLKRNEAGRFQRWLEEGGVQPPDNETTEWEQREYFDFF